VNEVNQPQNLSLAERHEAFKAEVLAIHSPTNSLPVRKKVGKGKGTFVLSDVYESGAFWALKGAAPQMLIYLFGKREFRRVNKTDKHPKCVNDHELFLSYIELQKLGITQPRATRGFDDLLAKGFIEIIHAGGGCQRDQSIYSLSNRWLFWKRGTIFSKRPGVIKRGFQGGTTRSN
jgi:hypothetical protein